MNNSANLCSGRTSVWRWLALAICLAFAGVGLLILDDGPPLRFDEGWVLTVAKEWVQTGYYGEHLLGKPYPASMMNIGFPAVLPIGLSFSVFGVGIWQARLPSLLFTAGSLYLIFFLTSRLSNRSAAYLALLGLLVTSTHLHPMILGRQALGESAAIFFFLAGFALFLYEGRGARLAWGLAALSWGCACVTKAQFLPFLTAAFAGPLLLALYLRQKAGVKIAAVSLAGTGLAYMLLLSIQQGLVGQAMLKQPGLYSSTAFVPVLSLRTAAFIVALTYGFPSLLALYAEIRSSGDVCRTDLSSRKQLARLGLLVLAVSWELWYLLLSVGWARYLYPVIFVSSIFLGQFLSDLLFSSVPKGRFMCGIPRLPRTLLALGLLLGFGIQTARTLASVLPNGNASLIEVIGFLESKSDAKIVESYEAEVLFFLPNEKRHHPPDSVQLQLNRRAFLRQATAIAYDPLAVDPDLLVVGCQNTLWGGFYNETVKSGNFTLVKKIGDYEVYQRIRPARTSAQLQAK